MTGAKKELSSEQHTLYSETILEQKRVINKEKHIYEVTPKHKRYRVYIGRFFELKKGLHSVFNELREAKEHDYLEFMINSGGGFVHEGMQFFNIIQEKFSGRTVAYLDNHGYSMGALLFCMADKRVVYPYSDLMFHTYSHGSHGKGGEVKSHVEHTSKKLEKFFYDIIVKQGFLSEDEFQQMVIGQDYWMDAKELCSRGIATHVIIAGEELTAKQYVKNLKKEKSDKKAQRKLDAKKKSKKK
jgi:ATP-dependent protease ClpP protease subunit